MLKRFLLYLCGLALLSGGLVLGLMLSGMQASESIVAVHVHSGPTLEQVRSLSSLVTLRAEVADVQVSELHGYSGGVTAALLVKGDVVLATDLSQARFESVNRDGREAVLVLPPPQVQTPRVDHSRTKLVELWRSGLWEIVPGDQPEQAIMNRAYAEAQRIVETAGTEPSMDQRARAQAESVLGRFFEAMGWKMTIHWSDRR